MEATDISKAAEELVVETYAALVETRRLAISAFIEALRAAHKVGHTDEYLSALTRVGNGLGYSRTRIGQLRAGKIGGRDK